MILAGDIAAEARLACLDLPTTHVVCNLESPLLQDCSTLTRAAKAGPHLASRYLPEYSEGRLTVSLANNHIMDFGAAGLLETCSTLSSQRVGHCGAGRDIESARKPFVFDGEMGRVALLACCETQFGVATAQGPGVASFGDWVYAGIREAKKLADHVIVSVHAGNEMSPWPSPNLQALYRSWIEVGVDVVHGHHPHVPQGYEEYEGGLILYGTGNFAVNPDRWRHNTHALWSIGARISGLQRPITWELLVFDMAESGNTVRVQARRMDDLRRKQGAGSLAEGWESALPSVSEHAPLADDNDRTEYLRVANMPLEDSQLSESLWQEVAVRSYFSHYRDWIHGRSGGGWRSACASAFGNGRQWLMGRNGGPMNSEKQRRDLLLKHVLFACETHRDAIATAAGVLSGAVEDLRNDYSRELVDHHMPWLKDAVA